MLGSKRAGGIDHSTHAAGVVAFYSFWVGVYLTNDARNVNFPFRCCSMTTGK